MLLPFLSVGPEPAIISATEILLNVFGIVSVPEIFPVEVCSSIFVSVKDESAFCAKSPNEKNNSNAVAIIVAGAFL
jgi:hypothetical protein